MFLSILEARFNTELGPLSKPLPETHQPEPVLESQYATWKTGCLYHSRSTYGVLHHILKKEAGIESTRSAG